MVVLASLVWLRAAQGSGAKPPGACATHSSTSPSGGYCTLAPEAAASLRTECSGSRGGSLGGVRCEGQADGRVGGWFSSNAGAEVGLCGCRPRQSGGVGGGGDGTGNGEGGGGGRRIDCAGADGASSSGARVAIRVGIARVHTRVCRSLRRVALCLLLGSESMRRARRARSSSCRQRSIVVDAPSRLRSPRRVRSDSERAEALVALCLPVARWHVQNGHVCGAPA